MRHHQGGVLSRQHPIEHSPLGERVEGTCGLVQDQQVRAADQRPRDTESLLLPAGQLRRLAQLCMQSERQLTHHLRQARRLQDLPRIMLAQCLSWSCGPDQVLPDRARHEHGLLRHVTESGTPGLEVLDRTAFDEECAVHGGK